MAEWYAHHEVRFYPTGIDRQLWQPPAGEYLVLAGYGALGGRDWLANLPQWLAGAGAVGACAWTVGLLGGTRRVRLLAAAIAALVPALVLEASSSQTDLLVSLWLLIATGLLVERYAGRSGRRDPLWFGAAIGLAVATKGTALPFGLPLVLAYLGRDLARRDWSALGAGLAAVVGGIGLLAGAQYFRNAEVFGDPLGPASIRPLLRPASLSPLVILSNAVTNLSLHFGTPWTGVNEALTRAVAALHRALGLDLQALYPYFGGYRVQGWSTHEDLAGSPFHVVLAGVALVALARRWKTLDGATRAYLGVVSGGAVLFVLTVRWQPFNTRLALPAALVAAPAIAIWLDRRRRAVAGAALTVLAVAALPALVWNASRPLLPPPAGLETAAHRSVLTAPRLEQYFVNRPALTRPYQVLVDRLGRGACRAVALQLGYDSWEYPLWVLGRPLGLRFDPVMGAGSRRTTGPGVDRHAARLASGGLAGWPGTGLAGRAGGALAGRRVAARPT